MVATAMATLEYGFTDMFAKAPTDDIEAGDILHSKEGYYTVKDEENPFDFTEDTADHISHLLFGGFGGGGDSSSSSNSSFSFKPMTPVSFKPMTSTAAAPVKETEEIFFDEVSDLDDNYSPTYGSAPISTTYGGSSTYSSPST